MHVGWFLGRLVREHCKTNGIAVAVGRENSGREVSRYLRSVQCGCGKLLLHWENCLHFVYVPRCVSFFYAPNCINASQKVNLKKMHPAAFYFSCTYTNGNSLRIIIKDYKITQSLINETALNLPL